MPVLERHAPLKSTSERVLFYTPEGFFPFPILLWELKEKILEQMDNMEQMEQANIGTDR